MSMFWISFIAVSGLFIILIGGWGVYFLREFEKERVARKTTCRDKCAFWKHELMQIESRLASLPFSRSKANALRAHVIATKLYTRYAESQGKRSGDIGIIELQMVLAERLAEDAVKDGAESIITRSAVPFRMSQSHWPEDA